MATTSGYSDVIERYKEKMRQCGGVNPFKLDMLQCRDPLPVNVAYFDIVQYCINKGSTYTLESFKSYKSLEAHKLYEGGWVKKIACKKFDGGHIVIAKVNHTQRLREKVLHCWICVEETGVILCGHCTCMAGLGEVCSHIAATLFLLEAWGRKSKEFNVTEASCTDIIAKWVVPPLKTVEMAAITDIKWSKKEPKDCIDPLPGMSNDDINNFLNKVKISGSCSLMAMRKPFSDQFVPLTSIESVKKLQSDEDETEPYLQVANLFLLSLFKCEYVGRSLQDLCLLAEQIELSYTEEQILYIEQKTRKQHNCKLWFRFRTGRITASLFKNVCRTSINAPSTSLISQICYPENHMFHSKYTIYGNQNESNARQSYEEIMSSRHTNFSVTMCGLVINNSYPHCGATPDGIRQCDCCGKGSLEIKCPWTFRFDKVTSYLKRKDCPLWNDAKDYFLKTDHQYYYQVQFHMYILDVEFSDFIVWNSNRTIIVTIPRDEDFWNKEYPKIEVFWNKIVMPELLGCHFSREKERKMSRLKQFSIDDDGDYDLTRQVMTL